VVDAGETVRLRADGEPVTAHARSVVMERQYRHPVGQVIHEFPAGKLDAGEPGLACAKRELLEETGFAASHWAFAGTLMPAVAYADEVIEIWFARGLAQRGRALDDEEFLDVELVDIDVLGEWCRQGRLPDAKSVTCLWWLEQWCAGRLAFDWAQG
jgi:ADP-ribose pyrophosphatase